jgi:hypothetical protein
MLKRVHMALAVALVTLAGVIAWQVFQTSREREPVYQGKRLSAWLEILFAQSFSSDNPDDRANQAVRHFGTNALPFLMERLQAQDTPLKEMMMALAAKQKLVAFHFKSTLKRRQEALIGYKALGTLAIPSLVDTLTNNPSPSVRGGAAEALGCIGPAARLVAPALFCAAKDKDNTVRPNAFWALGQMRPDPHLTIPLLVAGLDDPYLWARVHAAQALGEYGPEARAAVPVLLRMLATNSPPDVEYGATASALKAIDPEAAAKAGAQ